MTQKRIGIILSPRKRISSLRLEIMMALQELNRKTKRTTKIIYDELRHRQVCIWKLRRRNPMAASKFKVVIRSWRKIAKRLRDANHYREMEIEFPSPAVA
jgi:hypothetical protein